MLPWQLSSVAKMASLCFVQIKKFSLEQRLGKLFDFGQNVLEIILQFHCHHLITHANTRQKKKTVEDR